MARLDEGTMTKSFGVKCKGCDEHIHLADVDDGGEKQIVFYAVPLEPITCPICGHKDIYGSRDKVYKSLGARTRCFLRPAPILVREQAVLPHLKYFLGGVGLDVVGIKRLDFVLHSKLHVTSTGFVAE